MLDFFWVRLMGEAVGATSGAGKRKDASEFARRAIEQGVAFTPDALDEVYRVTQGYPYFLQEWGYQSWNMAEHSPH